jgi:hypothetical protein
MQLHLEIRSLRETCALHHTALNTEKSYTRWLIRYAAFLKRPNSQSPVTTEEKMEAFLTPTPLVDTPCVSARIAKRLTRLAQSLRPKQPLL